MQRYARALFLLETRYWWYVVVVVVLENVWFIPALNEATGKPLATSKCRTDVYKKKKLKKKKRPLRERQRGRKRKKKVEGFSLSLFSLLVTQKLDVVPPVRTHTDHEQQLLRIVASLFSRLEKWRATSCSFWVLLCSFTLRFSSVGRWRTELLPDFVGLPDGKLIFCQFSKRKKEIRDQRGPAGLLHGWGLLLLLSAVGARLVLMYYAAAAVWRVTIDIGRPIYNSLHVSC